ncbi:MAG TPA: hypothetical protein VMN03_08435 [Burkholderiales bacterium]|nr:hypothetical protein [Burkholderiales bacterium]
MTKFFVEAASGTPSDDNVRRVGEFETRDEAFACVRRLIDALLIAQHRAGMYPRDLLARYQAAGEQFAIFQDDDATMNVSGFNPLQHAKQRCQDYCGKKDPA